MTLAATQPALFTESIYDALSDVVRALGGPKDAGKLMRPTIAADDAGQWVKDCLNPTRRERFNPEQVLWLVRKGREAGCHSIVNYLADEGGYTRPTPIEPKDEEAELMRQFIATAREQRLILERLERCGIRVVG